MQNKIGILFFRHIFIVEFILYEGVQMIIVSAVYDAGSRRRNHKYDGGKNEADNNNDEESDHNDDDYATNYNFGDQNRPG
jgi:hypothetical protein